VAVVVIGVIAVGAALAGMAFGRLVSAVVDDRTAFYPNWFYLLVEAAVAGAYLRFRRDSRRSQRG
jgi:hypothetical protein